MKQLTYPYLSKYKYELFTVPTTNNFFYPVSEKEIKDAEEKMGFLFPSQLRDFYQEVGCGRIQEAYESLADYQFFGSNSIMPPSHIALVMKGILIDEEKGLYFSQDTYEDLEPGDLPFFEIADGSSFLVMKVDSSNPNAVWSDCGVKIEDSFERFIWRLYYEDPGFYGPIIEAHYAELE